MDDSIHPDLTWCIQKANRIGAQHQYEMYIDQTTQKPFRVDVFVWERDTYSISLRLTGASDDEKPNIQREWFLHFSMWYTQPSTRNGTDAKRLCPQGELFIIFLIWFDPYCDHSNKNELSDAFMTLDYTLWGLEDLLMMVV